uniref:Ubiquitin-like domain-containing protein n=1 Tax=Ditylenchus dipsaci TaxID=166011 RepID=A0A915D4I3_9BILA
MGGGGARAADTAHQQRIKRRQLIAGVHKVGRQTTHLPAVPKDQHVAPFINIFGTSPCKVASERGLELLVLNRKNISSIGDQERFASFTKNVQELDLAWNKIEDWEVVSNLFSSLPSLKQLNLGHNPIQPYIDPQVLSSLHAPKLNTLVLNGVNLPLETVKQFLSSQVIPCLTELHMSETHFMTYITLKSRLATLWRVLSLFPNTENLYLVGNELECVDRDCLVNGTSGTVVTRQVTQAIKFLSMSECGLNSWESIENLQYVGKLEELRVRNIPLLDDYTEEERYHLIVGRLKTLTQLNGSVITPFQREESERFFIRYYQCAEEKPAIFDELVKEHGNLEALVKVDLTPRKFAKVMMRCEETNYLAPAKIRLSATVIGLMKYAAKITEIPVSRMRLFYFDGNLSGHGPTELRFPNQMLSSLHIEDGDEFYIQSKIVVQTKQKTTAS